jgi:hypothetical protein
MVQDATGCSMEGGPGTLTLPYQPYLTTLALLLAQQRCSLHAKMGCYYTEGRAPRQRE